MWATVAKTLGLPLIKQGFQWLTGKQDERKHSRALKSEWELAALKRSSMFLRIVSYITLWGPMYYSYYLAMTLEPIETPEDVADAVKAVFNAFPAWWTGAAVAILLAVWGIKERDTGLVARAVADKEKAAITAAPKEEESRRVVGAPR